MADKKISQLTELTSANAATDFLPVVDTSAVETKKITLANLPLSDAAKDSAYPYTTDFQSGVEQTRNLTTITSSDGYSNNGNLSSIYLGTNVTSIGDSTFYNCTSLTSITIPDSVTSIGSSAFYQCTGLTSVNMGNSVTSIGFGAFYQCTSLTSATIGNSVTSIGTNAFYQCSSLTSINIPDSVTSIGSFAFYGTNLTYSSVDGIKYLFSDSYAFLIDGSIASGDLSLPSDVGGKPIRVIADSAFSGTSLTSATIGNSVTSIGSYAFYQCASLTSATIGNSVTSIGNYAFNNCSSLATINCLATTAPTLGFNPFNFVATSDIHVPVGAAYPATYGGLTVVFDL